MAAKDVLIIAHRGASGYLPEHTLEAKAFAYALGADFIEQDLVATRDDELIVVHDIHLDRVTDVAEVFPERARDDGRYYARDFDLAEIRLLRARERRNSDGKTAVFPKRFPIDRGNFRIPTFSEEIELIQGLNRSTGRDVGIYPEIKQPAWHRDNGVDLSKLVLRTLGEFDYRDATDNVFLQCFDIDESRRIRSELGSRLRLIQLLDVPGVADAEGTGFAYLASPAGLQEIASFADGVAPWLGYLAKIAEIDGQPVSTGFVSAAHALDLLVHPWTFRAEELIPGMDSLVEMVQWCVEELSIDGLFTDFPDLARQGISREP
jgi:glycerophosphoryl diester phosphodiesterase